MMGPKAELTCKKVAGKSLANLRLFTSAPAFSIFSTF